MEDFGIIPVGAQGCGCPLIAFDCGGVQDIVSSETAVTFNEQSVESLLEAIARFERASIDAMKCAASAQQFSEARFDAEILRRVSAVVAASG